MTIYGTTYGKKLRQPWQYTGPSANIPLRMFYIYWKMLEIY